MTTPSLRDQFAMAILTGFCANPREVHPIEADIKLAFDAAELCVAESGRRNLEQSVKAAQAEKETQQKSEQADSIAKLYPELCNPDLTLPAVKFWDRYETILPNDTIVQVETNDGRTFHCTFRALDRDSSSVTFRSPFGWHGVKSITLPHNYRTYPKVREEVKIQLLKGEG